MPSGPDDSCDGPQSCLNLLTLLSLKGCQLRPPAQGEGGARGGSSAPRSLKEFGLEESSIDRLLDGLEKSKGKVFGAFKPLDREDAQTIYKSAF